MSLCGYRAKPAAIVLVDASSAFQGGIGRVEDVLPFALPLPYRHHTWHANAMMNSLENALCSHGQTVTPLSCPRRFEDFHTRVIETGPEMPLSDEQFEAVSSLVPMSHTRL